MRIVCRLILCSLVLLGAAPCCADDAVLKLEADLQIISVPLASGEAGSVAVPVNLRVQSRCIFGDFEAVLFDMLHSEKPLAILTLEPLLPELEPQLAAAALIRKPEDLLSSGFAAQLPVADTGKTQLLALHLCKDSSMTQRCRDKDFTPINSILAEYQKKSSAASNPPDRVYTYALVIIRNGRAYASRAHFTAGTKAKWRSYLHSLVGPDPIFERSFEIFWKRVTTLDPYPVGASSNALVLTLPRYDRKKCGHGSPQ